MQSKLLVKYDPSNDLLIISREGMRGFYSIQDYELRKRNWDERVPAISGQIGVKVAELTQAIDAAIAVAMRGLKS